MKSTKSLFSIAHDHFHGLLLAQMIKKGSQVTEGVPATPEGKAKYTIHYFEQELDNHFYLEEHVLQPEIAGINSEIDMLFKKLVDEHNGMRKMVKQLKSGKDLEDNLDKFGRLLEDHVKNEERNFFPKIQEALSEDELEKLAQKLKDKGYEFIFKY